MTRTIQTITENDCSNKHWNELFEQTLKRTVQTNTKTVPRLFLLKLSAQFISVLQNHITSNYKLRHTLNHNIVWTDIAIADTLRQK
jgi:hypothetical protein